MKNTIKSIAFLILLYTALPVMGQNAILSKVLSKDSSSINKAPGMFTQYSLFGVSARDNGVKSGAAFGGRLEYAYIYNDVDIPEGENHAGFYAGTAAIEAGYGGWIPYEFSVGAAGGVQFRNRVALGFQYNILGIYGYSSMAYGGSGIKLKARYDRLTVGWSRDGIGYFSGAFKNRDFSANHIELKADIIDQWGIGFLHTWLDRGNPDFKVSENRIFIGKVF
jgi:hypothetical protein